MGILYKRGILLGFNVVVLFLVLNYWIGYFPKDHAAIVKGRESRDRSVSVSHINIFHEHVQEIAADKLCVKTKIYPEFLICVHDPTTDIYISKSIISNGHWERHVYLPMRDLLLRDQDLGLIDIGANLGYFSLAAAAMGRTVLAVEPYPHHVHRFYKSVLLNSFEERVTILQNAISDTRTAGFIKKNSYNLGDTRVHLNHVNCLGNCSDHVVTDIDVKTILMDDILEGLTLNRAIMKVDIQGYEHLAFAQMEALFKRVFIPVIFMEWEMYGSLDSTQYKDGALDVNRIEKMIKLLCSKNYRPFASLNPTETMLRPKAWREWPGDIVWKYLL